MKNLMKAIRMGMLVALAALPLFAQAELPAIGKASEAPAPQAGTIDQPTLAFAMERRMFYVPKADSTTSPTLSLEHWQQDIGSRGYTEFGFDEATDRPYMLRNSVVEISQDEEGDLIYRESVIYTHEAGYDLFPLREVEMPLTTAPRRAVNTVLSLHPLGFIDPDFLVLRDLLEPFGEGYDTEAGFREHVTPTFIYRFWEDPESRRITEIRQYVREDGGIVRRIAYDDYYRAPSGRIIPRSVVMRTFLKDEEKPVTELRFFHVLEKPEE